MALTAAPGYPGAATPGGYSWEIILDRANAWADAHGYPRLTRDTLIEFRRDELVPGPDRQGRGRGGGRGAAWSWSGLAYLRVLRLLKLRAAGITARRLQRSILFAGGATLDIGRVRADLRRVYERDTAKINHDYGTEFITDNLPTPANLLKEVEYLLDPILLEQFLATAGAGFSAEIKSAARQLISNPAAAQIIELALRQTVLPEPADTLPALRRSVASLPAFLAKVLEPELNEISATMAGLLAHPDAGNAILEGLDKLTDHELIVVRDYALGWPDLTLSMTELFRALPDDPETEHLRPLADVIAWFFARMSPANRLALLGFFIARARAIPGFLRAAEATIKMRVPAVLREMARRGLLRPDAAGEGLNEALAAVGLAPENRHLWLDGA